MSILTLMQIECVRIPATSHACLAGDTGIAKMCLAQGRLDWDRSILETHAIARILRSGNTVMDVGAYIGDTTVIYETAGCTVFAFEPRADAFSALQFNCPRSICLKKAVGLKGQMVVPADSNQLPEASRGDLAIRQMRSGTGGSASPSAGKAAYVPAISLDELNPHACHFLKISAAGFEPYVLDGARSLIERTRPVMQIEINETALRDQGFAGGDVIFEMLREWRYAFKLRNSLPVGARTVSHAVCVPEERPT